MASAVLAFELPRAQHMGIAQAAAVAEGVAVKKDVAGDSPAVNAGEYMFWPIS